MLVSIQHNEYHWKAMLFLHTATDQPVISQFHQ